MPKKSSAARAGAQRNKSRSQKSFELVRPGVGTLETQEILGTQETSEEQKPELQTEAPQESVAAKTQAQATKTTARKVAVAPSPIQEKERKTEEAQEEENKERLVSPVHKGSAAARLAARRQATQRAQQRSTATLITAEHFAYVRRDLITIAVLAAVMFTAIIVLYFTIGRA